MCGGFTWPEEGIGGREVAFELLGKYLDWAQGREHIREALSRLCVGGVQGGAQ